MSDSVGSFSVRRASERVGIAYLSISLCCALFALAPGCASGCAPERPSRSPIDDAIEYYSQKVAKHPRHYSAYALLGAAYLDKTRRSGDPAFLKQARAAIERSLANQPNFQAMKTMAALCNFSHRFADALQWGQQAAQALPADTGVTAMLVEAYMGLGRYDDAAKLLPAPGVQPEDFYVAAAQGHWFAARRQFPSAASAFMRAAGFAAEQNAVALELWAGVSAAGALLDAGATDSAQRHLDEVSRLDPADRFLRLHQGELLEAQGRLREGLSVYERLLADASDPAIHARAFKLARDIGDQYRADRHFESAEKGFVRAIEAGEVYTLGALARLYLSAGVNLEHARELAEKNLEYKRDHQAQQTFDLIRQRTLMREPGSEPPAP